MPFRKIAVLGLRKVGALAATLLHEVDFKVIGFDNRQRRRVLPFDCRDLDVASADALSIALQGFEAVLSCLPYHLNKGVAETAHRLGLHYFDLTEDVPTTQAIRDLAKTSKGIMAPQCGLAPGFVGIVGAHLAEHFDTVRSIRLRVGARLRLQLVAGGRRQRIPQRLRGHRGRRAQMGLADGVDRDRLR